MGKTGRYWKLEQDERVRCLVCPHACLLAEGRAGLCGVRAARNGQIELLTYGLTSGLCADPIEKKPLYHFHPASSVLSFGSAGCNLRCVFCQNASLSRARPGDVRLLEASPGQVVGAALENGCQSVAFTYNEPVVSLEYVMEVAALCRERGVKTVAVTAGFIQEAPRREFFGLMDAANIDLKSFDPAFYREYCRAELGPVLETIEYVAKETSCWLELTTLLIPGLNDSGEEMDALSAWVAGHAGEDTPLHLSGFHPACEMTDRPSTPAATLRRARDMARRNGLRHVYTGNVRDDEGGRTSCHRCGAILIERTGYRTTFRTLSSGGVCAQCGTVCVGHF